MKERTEKHDPNLGDLGSLMTVPADGLQSWRGRRPGQSEGPSASPGRRVHVQWNPLTHADERFLRAILAQPAQPSSRYPRLAGVSPRRAVQIRLRLVGCGYLREHQVNRAGRGRSAIVLEVTDSGRAALQRAGGAGEGP
ncbi:MAG: hypothetical protein WAZ94_08510 [Phycisphaerales bacterium]